jgi:hypothetical protein
MFSNQSIKNQMLRVLTAIIVFAIGMTLVSPRISFALKQDSASEGRDDIRSIALESLFRSEPDRASAIATDILGPNSRAGTQLKHTAMRLLARRNGPTVDALFADIARRQSDPELRQAAIHWLARTAGAQGTNTLIQLYDEQKDPETRQSILHWLAERARSRGSDQNQEKEAFNKILQVAELDPSIDLRQAAIHSISEIKGERSLDILIALYDKEKNEEIRGSILYWLGRSAKAGYEQKRALAKLFSVARTDPSPEMRRQAVYCLGTSKDPEAVRFIEDLLK